jgi:hypothetical protein
VSATDLTHAVWRKSSRSNGGGGECVEVAFVPTAAGLRDSKDPAGSALVLPRAGWNKFCSVIKAR